MEKETIRVEVPDLCSLHHLKQTVSQLISAAYSSLRLSLNCRDELHAPSPHDPFRSLGITSADLVFYTLDPSSQALASPLHLISHSSAKSPNGYEPQFSNFLISEALIDVGAVMADLIAEEQRCGGSNSETLVVSGAECMDIDDSSDGLGLEKYSVPFFLKRVLRDELGDGRSNHKSARPMEEQVKLDGKRGRGKKEMDLNGEKTEKAEKRRGEGVNGGDKD